MNRTREHHRPSILARRRAPLRRRRGIAMLLVLISLGTATILTMAYLSSRDNSAEIGANVADSAAARWSALSGLELGVSVLETEKDWRNQHNNGLLLDDHPINGSLVDLLVEDVATDAPPTDSTTDVRLTSIATMNGVQQKATALAHVDGGPNEPIVVDLSEFAVFTRRKMELNDNATITRWPSAPKSKLGKRLAVGTRMNDSGIVTLNNNAAAIDTTVYHGPNPSDTYILNSSGPALKTHAMKDLIPVPYPPSAPVAWPDGTPHPLYESKTETTLSADARFGDINLGSSDGLLNLKGDITIAVDNDIHLQSGSGILVDGNVSLVVFNNLQMDNDTYIEVAPGATLKLYAVNTMQLDDAYIGDMRADRTKRDSSGGEPYMDPSRIRIFGSHLNRDWTTKDFTVIKGSIYASDVRVILNDDSAVYGRIASLRLLMYKNSAVFYDPALDSGQGYTDPTSKLFDSNGNLVAATADLNSLDDAELQALADALGSTVDSLLGGLLGGGSSDSTDSTDPADPTPRPIAVAVRFETHGTDPARWESKKDNTVVLVRDTSTSTAALVK